MAITVTKSKTKQATLPKVEIEQQSLADKQVSDYSIEELADAYGSLQDQIAALQANPVFAKFELVEKELKTRLKDQLEPTDEATLQGEHWVLEIGACGKNARKIKPDGIPKIQAFVGTEAFAKIAKVNLSDCEKYLTPAQCEEVIETDTGYSSTRKIAAKFIGV